MSPDASMPAPGWRIGSEPGGHSGSATCNRAYLLAAVRAGLIALVLLVFLVGIVLL